jgi:hypothetical protein
VTIDGCNIAALEDGGTEIAVIKASCLPDVHYDVIGTMKLRGIVGSPVLANVIKMPIRLTCDEDCPLSVICAVCNEANEDLMLPSNVAERLYEMHHHKLLNNDCQSDQNET